MAAITDIQVQILAVSLFLSLTWGVYLLGTIREYTIVRNEKFRRREDIVVALRRFVVALCVWLFVSSYAFRVGSVFFGVQDEVATLIVFFALLGSNVVGSIFAVISLWLD